MDFYSIIPRGEILLVNLRETDTFSADQKGAVGGLFTHEILTTVANTPRELRKDYVLMVDELGEFVGQDFERAFGAVRKYKLKMVVAGQDLTTFRKGDIDIGPKVLSQCGTVVCFQQTYKEDLEVLADRVGRGELDFRKLHQIVDRPDGFTLLPMVEYSESFTWGDNWTQAGAMSSTDTLNRTKTWQQGQQQTWSRGPTHLEATSRVDTTGGSKSAGETRVRNPHVLGSGPVTESGALVSQHATANGATSSDAEQETAGGSLSASAGGSTGDAHAEGFTLTGGVGGNAGGGLSRSHKLHLVPLTREEMHDTGRLVDSVDDQLEKLKQEIFCLRVGQALVKLRSRDEAVRLQVATVREAWRDEDTKFRKIREVRRELEAIRDYYKPLPVGNAAQDARLDVFVGASPALHAATDDVGTPPDADGGPTLVSGGPFKN